MYNCLIHSVFQNQEQQNLPLPWVKGTDQNGIAFYVNSETAQIRRQPPTIIYSKEYRKQIQFTDPV